MPVIFTFDLPFTAGCARNICVWSEHILRAMPLIFTFGPIIYHGLCPEHLRLAQSPTAGYDRNIYVWDHRTTGYARSYRSRD